MYSIVADPSPDTVYVMDPHIIRRGWVRIENSSAMTVWVAEGRRSDPEDVRLNAIIAIPAWHAAVVHVHFVAGVEPLLSLCGTGDPAAPAPDADRPARWIIRPLEPPWVPIVVRTRW